MRIIHTAIVGFLASNSGVTSAQQSAGTSSAADARSIVEASAVALGGLDRLRENAGVRVTETGFEYLVSTLTRGDAPGRMIAQSITSLRSGRDSLLRRTLVQTFPMRAGAFSGTTVANRGVVAITRGNALAAANVFDAATAAEEIALAPEQVLITAHRAGDLRRAADTTFAGVRHHVVRFAFDGAPVRLFIDASSRIPTRIELTRAYRTNVFWAMWGDIRFTTVWSSWSVDSAGLWYPRQRTTAMNGVPFREYVVTALDMNVPISPDSVTLPDSVRAAWIAAQARLRGAGGTLPVLKPVMLTDDVVLYEGGYQAAAVRQPDGVVVIEAPESNAKSRAVLADIAARWPGARVKAVVTTSPMWMHIGGLREYVVRRVPVYVLDVNVGVVRALIAAEHRQAPDSLERRRVAPAVRVVTNRMTLGTGPTRIELRPARGQHASSMLLAWLPASRLLYASDVVVPDAFEPAFASAYRAELAWIVRREGLDVDRMFAEHLPASPWVGAPRQ